MNSQKIKFLHWTPRIICIIAILFVSLFALDAFEDGMTIWQQIKAFLIHLIPSFILLILLIVTWKFELVGGVIFIIISVVFSPIIFIHNYNMNESFWMSLGVIMTITFPIIVTGILFVISYYQKKKAKS